MANRTNAALVEGVLRGGNDYDTENAPDLTPYMRAANLITTRVAACATEKELPLTTEELREVETWLAAHFYVCSDQTLASKSTDGASGGFHGQTGKYIESSRYGQAAISLDPSGCLLAIAQVLEGVGRSVAGGFWPGKTFTEQIDYKDR